MRSLPVWTGGVLVLSLLLWLATAATAADQALIRIWFDGPQDQALLAAHPELDVAAIKPGVSADVIATAATLPAVRALGLRFEVVHEDLIAHYAARADTRDAGGLGIWHTYEEAAAWADSLARMHPEVVSPRWSLGQSHEGRDIWCLRVSDNPTVDEDEPEILLDGLHHAREIITSEFALMFVAHLAESYGTDPVATWLVDHRELYVVPIVNPDGLVYNEQTEPQGGGMWRKNRRDNGDGTFGVDLNRNYPYAWGHDDQGASPEPGDQNYRGPAAGSEPETQAMMALIDAHAFVTALSAHSYGDLTLHPWGYTPTPAPDAPLLTRMAAIMCARNGYGHGSPASILYPASGGTIDWSYGQADGRPRVLAFANEIGDWGDGFWPPEDRRGELFAANLWPMRYLMMAAGPYVDADHGLASDLDGGLLEPGERGFFWFTVANRAARAAVTGTRITLACDDPYVQLRAASRKLGRLAPMAAVDLHADPFPIVVDAACPDGHVAQVSVTIDWGEGPLAGSLQFMVGRRDTILADDLTSTANWLLEGTWGPSPVAHSAPAALTDSPAGDYAIDTVTSATLAGSPPVGLLTFWHRHQLERGYDFGRVQVAPDGGAWATVASFTGEQSAWEQATVDLGAYAGRSLRLRFQLVSDFSVTDDGWFIDDVVLLGGHDGNATPPPPQAVAPPAGAEVGVRPTLEVAGSTDPDGEDPLTYGFRVYADALLTRMVARVDDLPAGADGPDWTVPAPLPPGTYWWRAYAADGSERGRLAPARCFTVRAAASEDPPVIDGPRLAVLGAVGGEARLRLDLPRPARVRAAVHDARGARVRDLHDGSAPRGRRILVWDGRDDAGRSAASGVYLVRVTVDGRALTGRVVLLR